MRVADRRPFTARSSVLPRQNKYIPITNRISLPQVQSLKSVAIPHQDFLFSKQAGQDEYPLLMDGARDGGCQIDEGPCQDICHDQVVGRRFPEMSIIQTGGVYCCY